MGVVRKAGKIAIKRLRDYLEKGISFNQETALCGRSIHKNILFAKSKGYRIVLYYVGVDSVEIAKERVHQRVLAGGHGIPEKDIERRYTESLKKLKELLPLFDVAELYDNTEIFEKVARFENGVCVERTNKYPNWSNSVFE